MRLKANDRVIVIAGKHKGKVGKILKTNRSENTVVVEKVNMFVRHKKKTPNAPGQRIEKEAPIHASNVMLLDPKTGKPTRVGYRILKSGKKERFAKKSGETIK